MDDHNWLAEQFEANRTQLRAVAYGMLGSHQSEGAARTTAFSSVAFTGTPPVPLLRSQCRQDE